ncbi:hypothetical protein KY347_03300 [Candidatus Woesearchaeota archaeon]|nr:hypothetical protein [Candidatus Woesearchaeota archaeon]
MYEFDIVLEELEKSSLFDPENSMYVENDVFVRARILISEIKEKQEILGRLNSLSYNVGWLRAAVVIKDNTVANKAINNILKNEYSSISSIISELESLKTKIDQLEQLHAGLLKSGLSLDVKISLEQDFKEKHKKLDELYNRQKNVLFSLSSIFSGLAKEHALKNKNK